MPKKQISSNNIFIVLAFAILLSVAAQATSVRPSIHECPVCEEKSVTSQLMSYSNFGEPARDLSNSPIFSFADIDVCPNCLYAGYSDTWKNMQAAEKAKLKDFLSAPNLRLTAEEKAIVTGHEESFRESFYFQSLWARSCDELLPLSHRDRLHRILRLHYKGHWILRKDDGEEYLKQLAAHYREQAIIALKAAHTAEWSKPKDKPVYSYLEAELTRQAGRNAEAYALFQKVIAAESARAKADEQTKWILAWAKEQSLRASPDAHDPAKLIKLILPDLPDPWREEKATDHPKWPQHNAAVDLLAQAASSGKKPFSDALWTLLDRKPERLLALLETINTSLTPLRSVDTRWEKWFTEIATLLDQNKVPAPLSSDPNKVGVGNVLRRAVTQARDHKKPDPWFKEVLLPDVRKCVSKGGIPTTPISEKRLFPGLSLSMLGKKAAVETAPSLNQSSRALYKLWQQLPAGERSDVARIYVRILRKLNENYDDSFDYPVQYFLPEMAESEEGRAAIRAEFQEPWNSSFWKAICAYAAGMENSGPTLAKHPLLAKWGYGIAAKLFTQQRDPFWKEAAMKKLREDEYVVDEITDYLICLDLPETRKALKDFIQRARKAKGVGNLYTLKDLDAATIQAALKKIPIQ